MNSAGRSNELGRDNHSGRQSPVASVGGAGCSRAEDKTFAFKVRKKEMKGKRWNSGLPAWRATIDFYLTSARKMFARLSHTETTTPRGGSSSSSSALFRGHKDGKNVH